MRSSARDAGRSYEDAEELATTEDTVDMEVRFDALCPLCPPWWRAPCPRTRVLRHARHETNVRHPAAGDRSPGPRDLGARHPRRALEQHRESAGPAPRRLE